MKLALTNNYISITQEEEPWSAILNPSLCMYTSPEQETTEMWVTLENSTNLMDCKEIKRNKV